MQVSRIILLVYFIVCFLPVLRFRNNRFFYYILGLALIDPIFFILHHLLKIGFVNYMYIPMLVFIWTFPLIKIDRKFILTIPIILLVVSSNQERHLISVLVLEISLGVIFTSCIKHIFTEIIQSHRIKVFLVPLCLEMILNGVIIFLYYDKLNSLRYSYQYLIFTNILLALIIFIVGNKKEMHLGRFISSYLPSNKNLVLEELGNEHFKKVPLGVAELKSRELETLELLSQGLTSKEIAEKMLLSRKTIDYYRSNIRQKLGLESRAELMEYLKNNIHH